MDRKKLVSYLDEYLDIAGIKDYGPQGLQIEGRDQVHKIVGLVDSGQPCVDAALEQQADMMLVHHGIFWGPPKRLSGNYGQLVRSFMDADLNLYAAHLALDAHPDVGNNAELARRLGLKVEDWWANVNGTKLAALAEPNSPLSLEQLITRFEKTVGPVKLVQAHGSQMVWRVGILSGSGTSHIEEAAALGCDTFVTGETSHAQFYDAMNHDINIVYGGHYTTETVGVQALGRHLADKFGLEFVFVDLPTGM